MFWKLAISSLNHRRGAALLTLLAIAISVFSVTAVEHLRHQAKQGFSQTVSGVDLIVGARGGEINLLLYSVFYLGNASRNMSFDSFQQLQNNRAVKWAIPLSMGDSHRGFRVIGTNADFFRYFRYGQKQALAFAQGNAFTDNGFEEKAHSEHQLVVGAAIAKKLGYKIGDSITIAHGLGQQSFQQHDQHPFEIVGVLAATGTPVDQALYVTLGGLEAVHASPGAESENAHTPESITATLVGLTSRLQTFSLQRQINQYPNEALMAILPGATLSQLWSSINTLESTLRIIAWLILSAALIGLSATLLASMRERQHELMMLRTLGARPLFIFALILAETLVITLLAILLALASFVLLLKFSQALISAEFGIHISADFFSAEILQSLTLIVISSLLVSLYPGYRAYRLSLS